MLPSKYVRFLSPIIYGDDRKKLRANKDKNLRSPKIASTKIEKKKEHLGMLGPIQIRIQGRKYSGFDRIRKKS